MCVSVSGYEDFLHCQEGNSNRPTTLALDKCPANSVIYIRFAAVGYTQDITSCVNINDIKCWKLTYHREIMQCNRHRNCTFTHKVFNQQCWRWPKFHKTNFIYITYNCITGKEMFFYDSFVCNYINIVNL